MRRLGRRPVPSSRSVDIANDFLLYAEERRSRGPRALALRLLPYAQLSGHDCGKIGDRTARDDTAQDPLRSARHAVTSVMRPTASPDTIFPRRLPAFSRAAFQARLNTTWRFIADCARAELSAALENSDVRPRRASRHDGARTRGGDAGDGAYSSSSRGAGCHPTTPLGDEESNGLCMHSASMTDFSSVDACEYGGWTACMRRRMRKWWIGEPHRRARPPDFASIGRVIESDSRAKSSSGRYIQATSAATPLSGLVGSAAL